MENSSLKFILKKLYGNSSLKLVWQLSLKYQQLDLLLKPSMK